VVVTASPVASVALASSASATLTADAAAESIVRDLFAEP